MPVDSGPECDAIKNARERPRRGASSENVDLL